MILAEQRKSIFMPKEKIGYFFGILIANITIFLLLATLVIYHTRVEEVYEPMLYTAMKQVHNPPPVKPPSRQGKSTPMADPSALVTPSLSLESSKITSTVQTDFTVTSMDSPTAVAMPGNLFASGASLDHSSTPGSGTFNSSGANPFGSISSDNGPALTGYLYDLKCNKDGSPTNIQDDGVFKDRSIEKTDEAKWHWHNLLLSYYTDPNKIHELTDSVLNEATLVNGLLSGAVNESALDSYYRSKPLYSYQWSIANQTPAAIVKAFGVSDEVKPTHLLIVYKGTIVAPKDGTFRFICYSHGGVVAIRLGNEIVGGTVPFNYPLISNKPFRFGDKTPGMLPYDETAGKWIPVVQGSEYQIEIILTTSTRPTSLHLMMEEQSPAEPYSPTAFQWDTIKKRDNPRITVKFPLFALLKGVPQAPYVAPYSITPPAGAPEDVLQEFDKNGPHVENPDVAPDPIVFPGTAN